MATDAAPARTPSAQPTRREALVVVALGIALALLFRLAPELDLGFSRLVVEEAGLKHGRTGFNGVFYWIGDTGAELVFLALTLAMFGAILRLGRLAAWRARLVFLWLALFIGPGVVVNLVLKEHIDRPRPAQTVEFGGENRFVAAFEWDAEGVRGHSFVSGHVAFACWLMALAWIDAARRRRWHLAALGFGAVMAWTRLDSGQHWLSDAVFAWFVVYGCTAFAWWLTRALVPPDPAP